MPLVSASQLRSSPSHFASRCYFAWQRAQPLLVLGWTVVSHLPQLVFPAWVEIWRLSTGVQIHFATTWGLATCLFFWNLKRGKKSAQLSAGFYTSQVTARWLISSLVSKQSRIKLTNDFQPNQLNQTVQSDSSTLHRLQLLDHSQLFWLWRTPSFLMSREWQMSTYVEFWSDTSTDVTANLIYQMTT